MRVATFIFWRSVVMSLVVLVGGASACAAAAPSKPPPTTIAVTRIETGPSEILSAAEIEAIVAPYEDKTDTIADLNRVVDALNALYQKKGYITAKAILPPQKVKDGVVKVQLVEGHVGAIDVAGNRHTRTKYIIDRMSLKPGDLMRVDTLEHDLAYFNGTNDVQLKAQLKPGKAFGTTDYILQAAEPQNAQTTISLDDSGRSQTGQLRENVTWVDNSLRGDRDPLTISLAKTEGSSAGSLRYEFPIDTRGTRIGVGVDNSKIAIVNGALASAEVTGGATGFTLSLSEPLAVAPQRKETGTFTLQSQSSATYFGGAKTLSSKVTSASWRVALQEGGNGWAFDATNTVTGAYIEAQTAKDVISYTGDFVWQRALPAQRRVIYRATIQATPQSNLPSGEQFSAGGIGSVRGYASGAVGGDSGYLLSAELHWPWAAGTDGYLFADSGGVFAPQPGVGKANIASIGLGATITFSKLLTMQMVYGIPLTPDDRPGISPGRLGFVIQGAL